MSTEICIVCDEIIDPDENLSVDGVFYHYECFQCSQCNEKLLENDYSSFDGILYCKPHFEQTFTKNGRIPRELSLPKPSELKETQPIVSDTDDDGDDDDEASTSGFLTPTDQSHPFIDGRLDLDIVMNQFMQNPALIGLLDEVPNQTEMESQDFLRNMLDQFTRNPEMMGAISQLGQQMVDNQNLGSMFAAMSGSQSSGDDGVDGDLDMSFMVQQMMPFFSQAFYREDPSLNLLEHNRPTKQERHRRCYSDSASIKGLSVDYQMNLKEVAKKIEDEYPALEIFSSVVETTALLHENIQDIYGLADLCSEEELAEEFMMMMRRDVCRRLGMRYDRFRSKS
ncbi:hypothetical protein L2E82_06334 [Cichorium intybus]|uniref:Uncharacterized protein n=1 Tax=Cichorium intybus TaxID=13427 RepID=A0ACB9H9T1_CICIN|nr:hypothetical protein L2E82_06334 [Cichorium intybus]